MTLHGPLRTDPIGHRALQSSIPIGSFVQLRVLLPLIFFLFAAPICVMLAVLVPPGGVPDEPNHIIRADSLRHLEIFGRRFIIDLPDRKILGAGVVADPNLIRLGYFQTNFTANNKVDEKSLADVRQVHWSAQPTLIEAPNVAVYSPLPYIPAAVTLAICHATRVLPIDAILWARLVNALLYCCTGAASLALARHARFALFVLLTLPISLSLAASFNPDGLLIASVALAVSLASRTVDGVMRIGGFGHWIETLLLLAVISLKPPYAPLALILLLPHGDDRFVPGLWRPIGSVCVVMVPTLIWFAVGQHYVAAPLNHRLLYHAGPLAPATDQTFSGPDTFAQLSAVLHSPVPASHLLLSWFVDNGLTVPFEGVIGQIGTQDVIFSARTYAMWWAALGIAIMIDIFGGTREVLRPAVIRGLLAGIASAFSYVLVVLSLYLTWTQVGMPQLEGMQGRYLTPMLMVLALATPRIGVGLKGLASAIGVSAVLAAGSAEMVVMPRTLVQHYYMQP